MGTVLRMKTSLVFGILLLAIVTITGKQYLLETEPEPEPDPENIVPLGPYPEPEKYVQDKRCPKEEPEKDMPCNFSGKCAYNEVCCCENGIKEFEKTIGIMCDGKKWSFKTLGMSFCPVPCKDEVDPPSIHR